MNKRILLLSLINLLLLFGCSQVNKRSVANIFYEFDRQSYELNKYPQWGRLFKNQNQSSMWGTAFLVHSCYIATAYHVVSKNNIKLTATQSVYFLSNFNNQTIEANPVAWDKEINPIDYSNQQDWVLLRLKKCLPQVEPLKLASKDLLNSTNQFQAQNIGFPEDRNPNAIAVDHNCTVYMDELYSESALGHDCATRPGSSGSPILIDEGNIQFVAAISVSSRGHFNEIISEYTYWIANKACPISKIADALKNELSKTYQ